MTRPAGGPERRFAAFRAAEDGPITGVLVAYGVAEDMGAYRELVRPGAFGDVAALDLICNVQHQRARPVTRTGAGLQLTDSAAELRASVEVPDTSTGRDVRELVRLRVLRGFSVEMRVRRDGWDRAARIRTIERADLLDLALVDRPGYASAVIARAWQPPDAEPRPRPHVWL